MCQAGQGITPDPYPHPPCQSSGEDPHPGPRLQNYVASVLVSTVKEKYSCNETGSSKEA